MDKPQEKKKEKEKKSPLDSLTGVKIGRVDMGASYTGIVPAGSAASAREFLCRRAVVGLCPFCTKVDKTRTENITLSLDLSSPLKLPP